MGPSWVRVLSRVAKGKKGDGEVGLGGMSLS